MKEIELITSEQIEACKQIITDFESDKYELFLSAIEAKQKQIKDTGKVDIEAILHLLWGVFSMFFHFPEGQKHPFGPLASFPDGKRTMLPEDLTEKELVCLEELVNISQNFEFNSRIYDLLWIRRRNHQYAQKAFSAYLQLIEQRKDNTDWPTLGDWLKRATQIALELGDKAPERITIKNNLMELFAESKKNCMNTERRFWPSAILDIILENRLADNWESMGDEVSGIADSLKGQYHEAREYYDIASKYYQKANKPDSARKSKLTLAQLWEEEARGYTDGFLRAHRFENAIEAYRNVGGESEKVEDLIKELKKANQQVVSQMKPITVPVETSELIKIADEALKGKSGLDALLIFISLNNSQSYSRSEKSATEMISKHPLQALIGKSVLTSEGNVAAKLPDIHNDDGKDRISAEIIHYYNMGQQLAGATTLYKATQIISANINDLDKVVNELIEGSEFVEKGRIELYKKAIIEGFKGDLLQFTHIIIPQIENSVRSIYFKNGLKTTKALQGGVQRERDIDDLLSDSEAEKIFGKDMLWEMRSLLIEQSGPNLRNRLCHGLLNVGDFNSPFTVYLLWLILSLIVGFKKASHSGEISGEIK